MKSASAGLQSHLAGRARSLASMWKLTRADGTIMGFTDHDQDVDFDLGDGDGTITYQAATGFTRSEIASAVSLNVDNIELTGALSSAKITAADIRAGRYDRAEVRIFEVNWQDTSQGALRFRRGWIGRIRTEGIGFVAEIRGMAQLYDEQEIGHTYSPYCRADLGDTIGTSLVSSGCGVRLDPPEWQPLTAYTVRKARDAKTGSVVKPSSFNDRHFKCITAGTSASGEPSWNTTIGGSTVDGSVVWETIRALTVPATVASVTDNRDFTLDYTGDAPDAFFVPGRISFTTTGSPTPSNVNLHREVKGWTLSTKRVVCLQPFPFDVAVGDSVEIVAGCLKDVPDCRDKFDNIFNFRGEPHIPGLKAIFMYPDAPKI